MSLRIHELQGELNTEKTLNVSLRQSQQRFFDAIVRLKENGEISDNIVNSLFDSNRISVSNV